MKKCTILIKNLVSLLINSNRSLREYVWEYILRVRDNGQRNIKLDQGELIDMGPRVEILGLIWFNS